MAMARVTPNNPLARPLARWLVNNRQGNRWKSTRDTSLAILGLSRFMKGAGELRPDYELTLAYANHPPRTIKVNATNMFAFQNRIVIEGDGLVDGTRSLVIEKRGRGSLYANARLVYFSKEEQIRASGHEIEVARAYYQLTPYTKTEKVKDGKERQVLAYRRTPLADLAQVKAGTEIEVELTLNVANNYEYVMVEDRKPSGFEPVALVSGSRYANGLCSNMELRDEKVVFFISWLQQGSHKVSYRMRAEMPGRIHAMPCRAEAMYAPKLGGISDSWRVQVSDVAR